MSITPAINFTTVGNLSDVLKELPIASSVGYSHNNTNVPLINNKQQYDFAAELLNSNDPGLIQELTHALNQVDSSNLIIKNDTNENQAPSTAMPPIIQKVLYYNPNLFNGSLNRHPHSQQNAQHQQQQQQFNMQYLQQQQQQQHLPEHISPKHNNLQSPQTGQYQQAQQVNIKSPHVHHHQHHHQQQQETVIQQRNETPLKNNNAQVKEELMIQNTTSAASTSNNGDRVLQNKPEYSVIKNDDTNKLTLKISKKHTADHVVKIVPQGNSNNNQECTIEQILNDDRKIEEKFMTSNETAKNSDYKIKSNKFYSSEQKQQQQPVVPKAIPIKSADENSNDASSRDDKAAKNSKKTSAQKANLNTWQANIASQLALPSDFTPELIAQLAADGYDVVNSSSRKAPRATLNKQTTSMSAQQQDDDDDDEDDDNFELKIKNTSGTPGKLSTKNKDSKPKWHKIESLNVKREHDKQVALTNLDLLEHPTEHPSFKKFTQLIEDLFESYDGNFHTKLKLSSLSSDEIIDEYLINTKLCSELSQEAYKLNTYSLVCLIRKESLMKLQTILYFNIKDGIKQIDLSEDQTAKSEQDKLLRDILFDKFIRAADASITSLYLMTAEKINKEIIVEDLIEQISLFSKLHLTTTIFPHYDTIYRNNNFASTAAAAAATSSTNVKRTKLNFNAPPGGSTLSHHHANPGQKIFKYISHFYNRLREILNLIGDLIQIIDLTDTIIITLSSMCIMCFFVDNISELQLEAMKVLTNIFSKYEKHRQLIFDDILSSLAKLHSNKRNLRSYKCLNNEMIQMVSALSLQLIQCEVSCLNETTKLTEDATQQPMSISEDIMKKLEQANTNIATISFEEKETFMINTYENSSLTAKKFLSVFFHKCKSKQNEFDFRPIFENFIQDLLITVNKPEWPASELILNMLGVILVNQINNEQNDVASRVNSLEYLGQIVSTLRKDALETSKSPDRLKSVFKKIVCSNDKLLLMNYEKEINFDELIKNNDVLLQLQKTLILYLDSLEINDSSIQYAKRFFVAQWLKEISTSINTKNETEYGEEQVEKYTSLENQRKELYELIELKHKSSQTTTSSNVLDFTEAFLLCKYLCSLKKSLDKNFDYYLVNILNLLGGSNEVNTPTQVRSKAIKCLSLLIEADAQILLKQKVFSCVQANFLHQTISVREAAVDLIGRFITLRPELTKHYYNLLSDRILDVGVSVRKRVIKIFRDICINQSSFENIPEICVKILRRINDEDGIKKLVIDTFYNLWFIPISTQEQLLQRVLNIVDVISEFSATSNIAQSTEFFEQLFGYLINADKPASDAASKEGTSESTNENQVQKTKDVLKACKQIVDCLIENVLNTEANTTTPQAYKRLVSSFSTLHLLSKIKPENFINHAETLLPYLNIKSTNQNDNQIINSAARILESVTPLLHCPSNSFLVSLEESLCKLIFQGGMMIVNSCINCLGAVVNKLTKNYKLAADCFSKFYKNAIVIRSNITANKPLDQATKAYTFRMLFTLGLLAKQFDLDSEELKTFEICSKDDLFKLYMFFIKQSDIDTKHKALIGLGSFLTRYSDYMLTNDIKSIYLNYLTAANVPIMIRSQVFTNLTDYLNEEDKRNLAESAQLTKTHIKDDLKEMLDVQSGMASTIIQSYFKPILESYLTSNVSLRIAVVNCLNQILNQGLIYPIECVPYLIAMTTDAEKKIQVKALTHLTNLGKAHPGFIQSKSIGGLNMSFRLQKIIQTFEKAVTSKDSANSETDIVIRGITEANNEILSLNHHLYNLLRAQRSFRRAFTQQLLKMFDDSSAYHVSLGHLFYICDNLAYFPYQVIDEPLYLIHQIDIIISVTGVNILQSFKENLTTTKKTNKQSNGEKITENDNEKVCLDLDMSHICPSEEEPDDELNESVEKEAEMSNKKVNTNDNVKKLNVYDDDEEETLEHIISNLPIDLKPLKDCMINAQGCCLLLILKQFLKEVYSINDSKIQNYSPNDLAKVNDKPIGSRKTNFKFNPKQIMDYLKDSNKAVEIEELKVKLATEYLEFKELMLSIDCEEYANDENKKQAATNQQTDPNAQVATTTTTTTSTTPTNAIPPIAAPVCALKMRLLEGIEKVSTSGRIGGNAEQLPTTPRSTAKSSHSRVRKAGGGAQSSAVKKLSMKKRKRKKDANDSTEESDYKNSDSDEDF